MQQQNYEEYWKLTLEYTDFNNSSFIITLKTIVEKIDILNQSGNYVYNPKDYQDLQNEILNKIQKTSSTENQLASTRKAINQCVKLGFINTHLQSYHYLTKQYIDAKTDRKRKTIFSKIVYDNSSFNRSITNESSLHQLNFLINTLVENGKLSKSEIIALMLVDIENVKKGFLDKTELEYYLKIATQSNFIVRKYNQIGYLNNILNKLDEIVFVKDELYFTEDAKRIFGEDLKLESKVRNPYLHLLYKNQLLQESEEKFNNKRVCFLEKLDYPVLIASHIKPFIESNDIEAYDPNNGLLLSRTIDSLFDLKYISFTDEGQIIFSKRLSKDVVAFWKNYKLDKNILNEQRCKYLQYHRDLLTNKDK
ncbi:MAG: HNH endonuclease [Bacteroidetes bacterium]|nr:MAG: HNH endonuclease [Bacteroidota bacterium]